MKHTFFSTETMASICEGAVRLEQHSVAEGTSHRIYYPNGFEVSICQNSMTNGHEEGLWELAILKDGKFCCADPHSMLLGKVQMRDGVYELYTSDICGRLDEADVIALCNCVRSYSA